MVRAYERNNYCPREITQSRESGSGLEAEGICYWTAPSQALGAIFPKGLADNQISIEFTEDRESLLEIHSKWPWEVGSI